MTERVDSRVQRHDNLVRRPMAFWSPAVHDLLRHLEEVHFPASRLVGVEGNTELLRWIDGESGPDGWAKVVPETGLRAWASFLRRYHDAVRTYRPADGAIWSSGRHTREPGEIVCHGDFGPWNGVWRGERLLGLLDFDHARPAPPVWDVTYALQYAAPFRPDDECRRWLHYPEAPDRRRRIEIFCDSYGIPVPVDIVDRVADQQRQVLEHCDVLSRRGVEPQATWVRNGYLDVVRGRISWTGSLQL